MKKGVSLPPSSHSAITFLSLKREVRFFYAVSVDGLEIVFHGDDGVAVLTPFGLALGAFIEVGMVASVIVGDEHKCGSAVLRVAQAVVVHGLVATAVTKRQHGHLANLLTNLTHLVGLQVLDNQTVGAYQILVLAHGVIDTDIITLLVGAEAYVHANDLVRLNAQRLNQGAAEPEMT